MNRSLRLPSALRRWLAARLARPLPAADTKRRRACLYKVDRLGDFVLATGALHLLVEHFGAPECRLVVSDAVAALAAAEFPNVPRWIVPPTANGVWRDLRPIRARCAAEWASESFEELVCLRHAPSLYRDVSLAWIRSTRWHGLGARPTAANLDADNQPHLPTETRYEAAPAPWCGDLLAHRQVVASVLGREPSWAEMRPRLRHLHASSGTEIVLCPFGHEPVRDYPVALWLEAWRAAELGSAHVRVLGAHSRSRELNELAAGLRASGATATAESDLALPEFVRAIAHARAVLTVDSAAAHFATLFDKSSVIVIGGGHFGWFGPWGDCTRQRWLAHQLDCFGCNWHCRFPTVRCLLEIPPSRIAAALGEVLRHA